MNMTKILEVSKPIITHTPEVSILFAILSGDCKTRDWLYLHFFSMGIDRYSSIENIVWFEDYYKNGPFLECIDINRGIIKEYLFSNYIAQAISEDYYLALPINIKYIKNYGCTENAIHFMGIYGYNKSAGIVYIMDHFQDGKFSFETCSFDEINEAYNKLSEADNIFCYNLIIRKIKKKHTCNYNINKNLLLETFQMYISGVCQTLPTINSTGTVVYNSEYENICFGLEYYDALANFMILPEHYFHMRRQIFLTISHATILLNISNIMAQRFSIDCRDRCEKLLLKMHLILNLYLKNCIKYLQFEYDKLNYIRIKILEVKELEKNIILDFIHNLRYEGKGLI